MNARAPLFLFGQHLPFDGSSNRLRIILQKKRKKDVIRKSFTVHVFGKNLWYVLCIVCILCKTGHVGWTMARTCWSDGESEDDFKWKFSTRKLYESYNFYAKFISIRVHKNLWFFSEKGVTLPPFDTTVGATVTRDWLLFATAINLRWDIYFWKVVKNLYIYI
jgi:hypothetical protein